MEFIKINNKTYNILRLLGKGKGGYSYLVTDGESQYVCKQIHHEPCDYYTFGDKLAAELGDYDRLAALGLPLPRLLAVDHKHERLLKEYIHGPTAAELVERDALPPWCVAQVEDMCRTLYAAWMNIDYFPTNFVLQDDRLWYIDYECNPYDPQWDFAHWGAKYWSKTPEFLTWLINR
jgi:hypothetical protein